MPAPGLIPRAELARPVQPAITRRISLHGVTAEIVAPRTPFARLLEVALTGYPTTEADQPPDFRVAVTWDVAAGAWLISAGEKRYVEADGPEMAARRAEWLFLTEALRLWSRFVHVHAAVVATARESVLLVGRSGTGKSTLSTALALAGLALYTDDVGLIERDTLRPVAVPRPVKLDQRSRRLLKQMGLSIPPRARLRESVARTALPGLPTIHSPGPRLTKVIFLAEGRRPRPALRELTAAEAVLRFSLHSATERFDLVGPTNDALTVINGVDSYELAVGEFDATIRMILGLVDVRSERDERARFAPVSTLGAQAVA